MTDFEKIETIFFKVLKDLEDYLGDLTLVGGWMPYIYSRFLWNNLMVKPVTTVDIDFGFGETKPRIHSKTIFEILSGLDYIERHPQMDRIYPVVLYKEGKIPIDFIASLDVKEEVIERLIGRQININKIGKFNFLLKNRMLINVEDKGNKRAYKIYCPKPSAFLYHKGATFIDRENEQKQAKDLHYMYFILRYAPEIKTILKEVTQYKKKSHFKDMVKNLKKYFERKSSQGCLMVERENGPDLYIDDLRQDIFDRFSSFLKLLLKE